MVRPVWPLSFKALLGMSSNMPLIFYIVHTRVPFIRDYALLSPRSLNSFVLDIFFSLCLCLYVQCHALLGPIY